MEVFILLVLSIGLCQASSVQDEVSCDDPEVFEAVARAIKELNEERTQGNKFALNVVLHAHRIADKKFHVIYQVRETTCPIAADKPWQNCDFSEGDYGNCTGNIDIASQEAISQNCTFGPGQENVVQSFANCLGCWHPIDPKSLEVLPIVRFTIRQFNNQSQQSALYEVREMKKATRQVVNGWNYNLEYSIKETNCSKNEFLDLSPACRHLPEGQEGSCTVNAHVDNANTLVHAQQDCKVQVEEKVGPPVRVCPGCFSPIATDSPELKEPLQIAIESFNAQNNSDFHFKIIRVTEATTQIVAGIMYRFEFTIQKTNCSKAEVEKLTEDCTAAEDGEQLFCRGSVYMKLWESSIEPQITCSKALISELRLRIPPGFTPFRNARSVATQTEEPSVVEDFHPDPRGRPTHEKKLDFVRVHRLRHDHRHGHRHGHRRGHKKPTESSSEEVTVLPAVETPSQAFLEQEADIRSPHEESVGFSDVSPIHSTSTDPPIFLHQLPDLPEPPQCPGTPWKPKRDPEPLDAGFSDFDLLDALQD